MSCYSKLLNPSVVLETPELAFGARSKGGFVDSSNFALLCFLAKESLIFI